MKELSKTELKEIAGGNILKAIGKAIGKFIVNASEAYGNAYERHIAAGGSHSSFRN